jgi:hypothetical protein
MQMAKSIRVLLLLFALEVPTAFAQQNPPVSQDTVLTFVHNVAGLFGAQLGG